MASSAADGFPCEAQAHFLWSCPGCVEAVEAWCVYFISSKIFLLRLSHCWMDFPARHKHICYDLAQDKLRLLKLDGFILLFPRIVLLVCPYLINETPWRPEVKRKKIPLGCNFWTSLVDVTFGRHFWTSHLDFTFERRFGVSLLDVPFERRFWISLLDVPFGRHFKSSLLDITFGLRLWWSLPCSLGTWMAQTTHGYCDL